MTDSFYNQQLVALLSQACYPDYPNAIRAFQDWLSPSLPWASGWVRAEHGKPGLWTSRAGPCHGRAVTGMGASAIWE